MTENMRTELNEAEVDSMVRYGITEELTARYVYKHYSYSRVCDAIAHAQREGALRPLK